MIAVSFKTPETALFCDENICDAPLKSPIPSPFGGFNKTNSTNSTPDIH